jgi:Zn-dependent peptidase ImmA (M78 family)/transcriptional regulator with XRE-family HTH domain
MIQSFAESRGGKRVKKTNDRLVLPLGRNDLHLAAHLFAPARLTLARDMRRVTKVELADRIDKSAAAVSQFEAGRTRPDPKTLASISLALGFPIGFFARKSESSLLVDACHFRSLRSASQRERRRLLALGTLRCDLLSLLEEHVELPPEQISTISRSVRSMEDIEECASDVRRAWGLGLGPIPNLLSLFESRGIVVSHIPDDCEAVDAFSAWHRGRPLVFLVRHTESTSRLRYDAAHELGHLVMHVDVIAGSPEIERQANRFAGAFLLPKEPFLVECPRRLDWNHFYELKVRWRVSVAALLRRAYDLDCISEASYRRAFVHLNRTGERFAERHEPPNEHASLLHKAIQLVAEDLHQGQIADILGIQASDLQELAQ